MISSSIFIEVFFIVILVLLNGFLSLAEMAIVSSKKLKLEQLAAGGDRGAKIALELANFPTDFLASVQIGITLVGILAGAFGGATTSRHISYLLTDIPIIGQYSDTLSVAIVVVIITFLSLILGELIPKRIALNNAEYIASKISRPIRFIISILLPAASILSATTEGILRIFGIKEIPKEEVTEEEVKVMIEQGARTGVFEQAEESMIKKVLNLGDRDVGDLMTQRVKLISIDINTAFEKNLSIMLNAKHSHFPVYEENIDNVIGIVSIKSILEIIANNQTKDLRKCLDEPLYVTETMKSLKLLEQFKRTGKHIALVVDEYGGNAGIITTTDILEAIVGELPEEEEISDTQFIKREDGSWLVDGIVAIHDFSDFFKISENDLGEMREYQSIGGFVMGMLEHIPVAGENFVWKDFRFEVLDMDERRVDKILVSKHILHNDSTPINPTL